MRLKPVIVLFLSVLLLNSPSDAATALTLLRAGVETGQPYGLAVLDADLIGSDRQPLSTLVL
ncbi:MAG TPA: hypothetical protein PKW15_08030, partial [Alphaproteobacteria bacterium]|nr:hypothetical protein [Alphaproteobacteria bacterium]